MRPDLVTQVWEIIVNCVGPYQKTSVNPPARRSRSTRPNALESVKDTETIKTSYRECSIAAVGIKTSFFKSQQYLKENTPKTTSNDRKLKSIVAGKVIRVLDVSDIL